MSRISIKIDVDLTDGELKDFTENLWTKEEERIISVLRRLDAGRGVTKGEISHNTSHTIPDAKNREAIIEQLIREGIIEIVSKATGKRGTRYAIRKEKSK